MAKKNKEVPPWFAMMMLFTAITHTPEKYSELELRNLFLQFLDTWTKADSSDVIRFLHEIGN